MGDDDEKEMFVNLDDRSAPDGAFTESRTFTASRLTTNNRIFPTRITVGPAQVVLSKRSWFSKDEESINILHIASVRIQTGIMFSDIWIESTGGANQIHSHGHSRGDAQEIKRLIEMHQRAFATSGRTLT